MEQVAAKTAARAALDAPTDQSLRVPCYCEENVWRLAYRKIHRENDSHLQYHVVFVTNPERCVPMFQQLAVENPLKPCFWDYHVILFRSSTENDQSTKTFVLDIDCHLPYPCALDDYLKQVFPPELCWPREYQPYFRWVPKDIIYFIFILWFNRLCQLRLFEKTHLSFRRVIDASVFLRNFSSDRMHMFNTESKEWLSPPPTYDCISNSSTCNLARYMKISSEDQTKDTTASENDVFGVVYSLTQLKARFESWSYFFSYSLILPN